MLKVFGVRTLGANRSCDCGKKLEVNKETIWEVKNYFMNSANGKYVCKVCAIKHLQEQVAELSEAKAQ